MTVRLKPDHERALEEMLATGRFASLEEAVAEAVEEFLRPAESKKREPIWERLRKLGESAPEGTFDSVPADGALEHDHYIYGTPKQGL